MKETQVTIGLSNPKSPSNVGAVMRAAGCYQVDNVLYTGQRYAKAAKFQTDTKSVARKIPLTGVESLLDDLAEDVKVVCVELAEGAVSLPEFQHPEKAIYIFGPEDGSITQDVADRADHVVYVPTVGCMNLAATVNVLLYDRLAKSVNIEKGDELIRKSRDNRNHLQVKQKTEAQIEA
ncbi:MULTISPECIES: RNA methyltransferase [Vibrio]|uniref:23S rRNA methyltransferase n=1 Tax=Vibrio genomosp. F6 str. FF-238 TaxID=1191298 RepID=A0A1E5D4G0_9VIBR|nr:MULTISPECIES: RNA methyltransferase [Vibrio]RBW65039.1 TrmH family RNA methyltransferase [Vibrionales bacterium C3R12]MDN3696236.1 RNA methyltransferase [Vibrio cortegadensis]NOH83856.1 RNA methyltransferase [Vibrio sp. 03-59-1]OEE78456.1 23S rRNA methyltransferase [Vibrio genomosp. F6 str. FF-238]TKF18947.1 RNA methyltransferase [Vibrio genomosp. F6]